MYSKTKLFQYILCLFFLSNFIFPQQTNSQTKEYLLFSYFKEPNGQDGLHLAYSTDGLNWTALKNDSSFLKPEVGEKKIMRDPSLSMGPDGTFHLVWTCGWQGKGIGYAESKDLINWSKQKYIPVMEHEPKAQNCWAPELFYDDVKQQYMIFWSTTIPGKFPGTDFQNKKPDSPGNNHRIYYVTTKDFETFSKAEILYNQGFNVIDAYIVKTDSNYTMFLKDETNVPFTPQKNIRLAFSKNADGPYGIATKPITGNFWAEGPAAIKVGNKWFCYFDKYREGKYGVVASDDMKKWIDFSDQLHVPVGLKHVTVLKTPTKIITPLLK